MKKYSEMSFAELLATYKDLLGKDRVETSKRMIEAAFVAKYGMERFLEDLTNCITDAAKDAVRHNEIECVEWFKTRSRLYFTMMQMATEMEWEETH